MDRKNISFGYSVEIVTLMHYSYFHYKLLNIKFDSFQDLKFLQYFEVALTINK